MNFLIPLRLEDLEEDDSSQPDQYRVQDVLDADAVPSQLNGLSEILRSDCTSIVQQETFDIVYGALRNWEALEDQDQSLVFSCLTGSLEQLVKALKQSADVDDVDLVRNTVVMTCFAGTAMIELNEKIAVVDTLQQGKKANPPRWIFEKQRILTELFDLLSCVGLKDLWDPPIPDEEFINMIGNFGFKLLENPEQIKQAKLLNQVQRLLNLLFTKYNYSLSGSLKLVQMLQQYEHLAEPLADVVLLLSRQGSNQIANDVLRELGRMETDDLSREGGSAKSCATFLGALASAIPETIIAQIKFITPLLDSDSTTLRNAVLKMLADVVVQCLSKENLDETRKGVRDDFLDRLLDHIHDVNAFVRARALSLWVMLLENKAIPLALYAGLIPKVRGRLLDKGQTVRKASIQFLTEMIRLKFTGDSKFLPSMSLETLQSELEKAEMEIVISNPGIPSTPNKSQKPSVESDSEDEENEDPAPVAGTSSEPSEENIRKIRARDYLKECVQILVEFQKAVLTACDLLHSKAVSDVQEAVKFLETCYASGIQGSEIAVRQIFSLVWSRDQGIKDAAVNAFCSLFVNFDQKDQGLVAKDLMKLCEKCSLREKVSLGQMMTVLVQQGKLHNDVIFALCSSFKNGGTVEATQAITLLGMAVSADSTLIKCKMEFLIEKATRATDKDLTLAVLVALDSLTKKKQENGLSKGNADDVHLVERLSNFLIDRFGNTEDTNWCGYMERVVNINFASNEHPEVAAGELLKSTARALGQNRTPEGLARFFALTAHSALQMFLHLDVVVCAALKNKAAAGGGEKTENLPNPRGKKKRVSLISTELNSTSTKDSTVVDELGLGQTNGDDSELEYVTNLMEYEVMKEDGIFGHVAKIVVAVCEQHLKYTHQQVLTAASLALGRLMLLSSKFCFTHLRLLFTLLERSQVDTVRANLMLVAGDLCCRFPNLIEPWTAHLYQRLQDDSLGVRLNCLLVLSHLILNDMIKLKDHLVELVRCAQDPDPRLSGLARRFLNELTAKSNNAMYNLLPGMISRLLEPDQPVTEDAFRQHMKITFSFIQKECQFDALVERVCLRFQSTKLIVHWRRLSYCFTLVPPSLRVLKKLQEFTHCFEDALGDQEVYGNLCDVLHSSTKPDTKDIVEELSAVWDRLHAELSEDARAAERGMAVE